VKTLDPRGNGQASGFRWLGERVWSVEQTKAEARPGRDVRLRIMVVFIAFAGAFAFLAAGAVRASLFSGASESSGPAATVAATRADLVDRNGALMATNLIHYGVYVDPDEVWDVPQTYNALLSVAPTLNHERLKKALVADHQSYLIGGLTPQERDRVHALGLPGISFAEEDKRVYPLGASAAHVIGFSDSGGRGIAGVEHGLDASIRDEGRNGAPVALSIDMRVQAALEDELAKAASAYQAKGAVGIITDTQTGEVLGLASWPSYDPSNPGQASDDSKLDRAATSVFEMGSTFKVFTMAAGVDSGKATLETMLDASTPLHFGNRTIHDDEAQNRVMSVRDVFIHSSNIGTSRLALLMGGDVLTRYFNSLGLFRTLPIELSGSAHPLLPHRWDVNSVMSASFGQAISVTPLQEAAAMGAILNGGTYVPLTMRKLGLGEVPKGRRVVSPQTTEAMLGLMRLNVLTGTGKNANVPGLRVGGKTGSAQKAMGGHYQNDKLVSSFAAVFPTDGAPTAKRYFVLILIDQPVAGPASSFQRTGAWTAAPIAGRVINRIAPFLGVARLADVAQVSGAPIADSEHGGD
jgi:cell division protein FtsI (penicillin-binding protein 3)